MLVSVVTPCRNEAGFIAAFIASVMAQQSDGFEIELLVADGRSNDGTRAILEHLVAGNPTVRCMDNPEGIVSTGLNRCIEAARGEIIVRMDVHTRYAEDYVQRCVEALTSSGAVCVGGPWKADGAPGLQRAIADAFQSPFGSGGARSRDLAYEGPCDTVYLGCWHRKDLLAAGGFDEALVRNQDDELALRLHRAGGIIWQSPRIRSSYTPRASIGALYRQFFQYGYWKVAVARKHGVHASFRHMVPVLFVTALAALGIGALFTPLGLLALLTFCAVYLAGITFAGFRANTQRGWKAAFMVALAIAAMHFGYGLGYALGVRDFRFGRRWGRASMAVVTR